LKLAFLVTNGHSLDMRIVIKKIGLHRWRVEYRLNGVRIRPSFKTKELAEAEKERVEKQVSDSGTAWLAMPAGERTDLMAIVREIKAAGFTPRQVWEDHQRGYHGADITPRTLQAAFDEFIAERRRMLVSRRTLKALDSNVGRFIKPRAGLQVPAVTSTDVAAWLATYKGRTYNTYLTSLNTFFRWCVKPKKYIKESPCAGLQKISPRRMDDLDKAPAVMTIEQVTELLRATRRSDPALLPYVAICLFAGLRPQREAGKLSWSDVKDTILVRGLHAKDRQRRFVPIHPVLREWLARPYFSRRAGPVGGDLPTFNLRKRFEAVRLKSGLCRREGKELVGWEPDWMRHTFASYHLASFGTEKTVEALGHGDYDMLFGHYRALVTKEHAEQFWKLTPAAISKVKAG
jgi:integrase